MVDAAALESILKEIEQNEGVSAAMLVFLAGTSLAGSFPKGVHVDTFGSMFAVLIGSAETVTSEARDVFDSVIIRSKASFFFSSRRRHTRFDCDWSSDVCSSD